MICNARHGSCGVQLAVGPGARLRFLNLESRNYVNNIVLALTKVEEVVVSSCHDHSLSAFAAILLRQP